MKDPSIKPPNSEKIPPSRASIEEFGHHTDTNCENDFPFQYILLTCKPTEGSVKISNSRSGETLKQCVNSNSVVEAKCFNRKNDECTVNVNKPFTSIGGFFTCILLFIHDYIVLEFFFIDTCFIFHGSHSLWTNCAFVIG